LGGYFKCNVVYLAIYQAVIPAGVIYYIINLTASQSRDLRENVEIPALTDLNLHQTLGRPAGMTTVLIELNEIDFNGINGLSFYASLL
jgi:hypothetical protein